MLNMWKPFLFSFVILIFIASCSKEEEQSDPVKTAYKLQEETVVSYHGEMEENKWLYSYNSKELISEIQWYGDGNFINKQTNYTYNEDGNILSYEIHHLNSNTPTSINYTYDADGRLIKLEDGYGLSIIWEYDSQGRLIYTSNERDERKNFKYNEKDSLIYYEMFTNTTLIAEVHITYNSENLRETEVYEWLDATNRTTWVYNNNGTIKEIVNEKWEKPDGPFYIYTFHRNFTYDDFSNLLSFEIYNVLSDPDELERTHTRVFGEVELKD